jgi:hypothetical protein
MRRILLMAACLACLFAGMAALVTATGACGSSGTGSGDGTASGPGVWDTMRWDQDTWGP